MATLAEIRAKYPQYSDLTDSQLADGLHAKFYADMPRADFNARIGFAPALPVTVWLVLALHAAASRFEP